MEDARTVGYHPRLICGALTGLGDGLDGESAIKRNALRAMRYTVACWGGMCGGLKFLPPFFEIQNIPIFRREQSPSKHVPTMEMPQPPAEKVLHPVIMANGVL